MISWSCGARGASELGTSETVGITAGVGSRASVGGGIVGVPPHRDLIYLTTGFRVPRGMQNNSDSRLLQQFFIRKIISVKVGSPRDIEIVQISGKITPVGFNLS